MSNHKPAHRPPDDTASPDALVLPLATLNRTLLPLVGGKAALLGELLRAGFAVPAGFCITTTAYARVAASAELDTLLGALSAVPPTDTARQAELAAIVRSAILHAAVHPTSPQRLLRPTRRSNRARLFSVAVRSSATAEDLPDASFAGQQETFLNTIGGEAVLDAVRRCWASLWNGRAVSYRSQHGIDPHTVRLAVVVLRMVDAQVAGVLFTAWRSFWQPMAIVASTSSTWACGAGRRIRRICSVCLPATSSCAT